jgi:hypothetical protein
VLDNIAADEEDIRVLSVVIAGADINVRKMGERGIERLNKCESVLAKRQEVSPRYSILYSLLACNLFSQLYGRQTLVVA